MPQESRRRSLRFGLQLPFLVLVLAFTAVPVDIRPLAYVLRNLPRLFVVQLDVADIVANILLYIPFGLLFASRGVWQTLTLAAATSLFAEAGQVFTASRSSGPTDVAANVLGAMVGLAITWWLKPEWRIKPPQFAIGRATAAIAAAFALALVALGSSVTPLQLEQNFKRVVKTPRLLWLGVSPRGTTADGRLEGRWTFEDATNGVAADASGNELQGRLVNGPRVEDGVQGRALTLNGVNQYVDLGYPTALQLTGSETITAWIKASSFPEDDAAVVSSLSGLGYQLDATIDRGDRTIGFKLANANGGPMARYGKTPLVLNTWYHIAGVYDAQAATINVYLNGEKDNGCLLGTVTDRQRISGMNTYVGRRASDRGFEFAGSIDDVRIYSRALAQSEIQESVRDASGARLSGSPQVASSNPDQTDTKCSTERTPTDSRNAGIGALLGLFVSIAMFGFIPGVSGRVVSAVCFAIGLVLVPTAGVTLFLSYKWLLPLLTLAGGASIALSANR